MDSWTGRSIVYYPAFDEEIERLGMDFQRLDDALAGTEWALSNRPEAYQQVYGSKLRMAKISGPSAQNLRIWFTFDDTTVTIVSVELSQDD